LSRPRRADSELGRVVRDDRCAGGRELVAPEAAAQHADGGDSNDEPALLQRDEQLAGAGKRRDLQERAPEIRSRRPRSSSPATAATCLSPPMPT
jgi:hypothetical protein